MKIAVITNVLSHYREGFYNRLFALEGISVRVYCQNKIPGMDLKPAHSKYPSNVKLIKSISAKCDRLVWQFLPWREILGNYDVIFISGNPRVLSDVVFGTLLILLRRKVVLWTMAHSYGANAVTEAVRLLWSRIFHFIFLYTDAETDYLRKKGFRKHCLVGMNNGLDQKQIDAVSLMWPASRLQQWRATHNLEKRILVLSCARLTKKNKFEQFVTALDTITISVPNILWCVIGSGTERAELESMVNKAGLAKHVRFVGELYVEEEMAPWFLSSEIFVHPAAIGLSLLHAFGYGLPVVTHGTPAHHNPEYTAFEPELTGRNFDEDDVQHLARVVINLLEDAETRFRMKQHVLRVAREKYNVDTMVERFVQIARMAANA